VRRKLKKAQLYEAVMENLAHALLFLELVRGPSYTIELRKKLGWSVGGTGEKLSDLLSIGFIKKVKPKDGKIQRYEVNWEKTYDIVEKETQKWDSLLAGALTPEEFKKDITLLAERRIYTSLRGLVAAKLIADGIKMRGLTKNK